MYGENTVSRCPTKRSRWDSNPHTLTGAGFRDRCNTNYATAPRRLELTLLILPVTAARI